MYKFEEKERIPSSSLGVSLNFSFLRGGGGGGGLLLSSRNMKAIVRTADLCPTGGVKYCDLDFWKRV